MFSEFCSIKEKVNNDHNNASLFENRSLFQSLKVPIRNECNEKSLKDNLDRKFFALRACLVQRLKAQISNDCFKFVFFYHILCPRSFTSRWLRFSKLITCGDVETNPGPRPGPRPRPRQGPQPGPGLNIGNSDNSGTSLDTKPSLQTLTYNVRGLNDRKKVRHLINFCSKQCSKAIDSVFMFQETFVERLDLLNYIWRGEHHLTPGSGQSLGCLTLVNAPFKIIHRHDLGDRGHALVLSKNNLNEADLLVLNLYAPNGLGNNKLDFFEGAIQKLLELKTTYNCVNTIVGGDLNLVFNESEVINRAITSQEKRIAKAVMEMFDIAELVDGWSFAPATLHTWSSNRNGKQMFSTLDRIMFSEVNLSLLTKEVDWSLSLSDHAMVRATFKDLRSNRKPCNFIPRLDARILDDAETTRIMDTEFRNLMDNASPDWNPHVALEYCKMSIRTAVFAATGILKARFRDKEKELNDNINQILNELAMPDVNPERSMLLIHKLDDLRSLKRQLVGKIGSRIEQRHARTWHNEGELSYKYFFNLLNRKTSDEINSILIDNEPCTDGLKIEAEIRSFYKDLYESKAQAAESLIDEDIFRHIDRVESTSAAEVTKNLTLEEVTATLKTCDDSAPGPDGITYSFLKHFWDSIGPLLLAAWHYSLRIGELPPSHKLSYLRLIPKPGKDSRVIGNLRPITLSNTDHKLITKSYSKRLTEAVSEHISQEQTAYLPNRLINDNIRSMLMTLDLANLDATVDGIIVSLDAKKAFDSVDHNFIRRSLRAFGISEFEHIFNVLYKGLRSEIILNGRTIEGYSILRGVKQGDALSCILFIICMEPLLRNIKLNPLIDGIRSTRLEINLPKVYGYADDVNAIVKADRHSIQEIFKEYEKFSEQSGLILNAEKTELMRFKKARREQQSYKISYRNKEYDLKTVEGIKINGILFFQDPKLREERNLDKVVASITKHLMNWSRRHLTLYGKILILKTYAISQAVFLMQSMFLNEKSLIKINQLLFKFLWNKNFNNAKAPDRIKRETMLTPTSLGGFGMTDIFILNKALNLRAIGRLVQTEHPVFK